MTIKEKLEKYILKLTNESSIDHDLNLFDSNLLTSLDALDLISFIEETFNISISEDDISMENLGSINSMLTMVERLKQKD